MNKRVWGAWALWGSVVATACSGSSSDGADCGPGTVLKDGLCVVDDSGNGGACDDCGNGGKAGTSSTGGLGAKGGMGVGGMLTGGMSTGGQVIAGPGGADTAGGGMPDTSQGGTPDIGAGGTPDTGTGGAVETNAGSGGMSEAGAGGSDGGDAWRSAGCGKAFTGQSGAKVTIQTSGVKDADCADALNGVPKCGAWSTPRDYYVYLPTDYDLNHPYKLVLEMPGCGGTGQTVYPLSNNNVDGTVIRVGLTPGPSSLGHGVVPEQGCFDTHEGDDSIDFVFYEALLDKLSAELCVDRNQVFASGNSYGGTLANELGCKYAGDTTRPIRGVMVNTGIFPTTPKFRPTCTHQPYAGMWVHEIGETTTPFAGNKEAIAYAMNANGCSIGTNYDTAQFENFAIGGGNLDSTCKKIKGCPERFPLVVCALPGNLHAAHDSIVNPGFSTFLQTLPP